METTSQLLDTFSPKGGGPRAKYCPVAQRHLEIQAQPKERDKVADAVSDWGFKDSTPPMTWRARDRQDWEQTRVLFGTPKLMTIKSSSSLRAKALASRSRMNKSTKKKKRSSRLRISSPRFPDSAEDKHQSHSHGSPEAGDRQRRFSASKSNDISRRKGLTFSSRWSAAQPAQQSGFASSHHDDHAPPRPPRTDILKEKSDREDIFCRSENDAHVDQGRAPTLGSTKDASRAMPSARRPPKPTPPPVRGFGDTNPQRARNKPASHTGCGSGCGSGSGSRARLLNNSDSTSSPRPQQKDASSPPFPSFLTNLLHSAKGRITASPTVGPGPEISFKDNASKDSLAEGTTTSTANTTFGGASNTASHAINRQRKAVRDLHQHFDFRSLPYTSHHSSLIFQLSTATIVADSEESITSTQDKLSSQPASPSLESPSPSPSPTPRRAQHRRKRSSVFQPVPEFRSATRPSSGGRRLGSLNTHKRHPRNISSVTKKGQLSNWLETEEDEAEETMLPLAHEQGDSKRSPRFARNAVSRRSPRLGRENVSMKPAGQKSPKNQKSTGQAKSGCSGRERTAKWSVPDGLHDIFTGQRFHRVSEVKEMLTPDKLDQLRRTKMAQAAAAQRAAVVAKEEARHSIGSEGSTPSLGTGSDTSDSSLWSVQPHYYDDLEEKQRSPATPPAGTSPTFMGMKRQQVIKRKALPPLPATDSRRNTAGTGTSSGEDIPIIYQGTYDDENVSPLRIVKKNASDTAKTFASIPSLVVDQQQVPGTPPLPPKSNLRPGKPTNISQSGNAHDRSLSDDNTSTSPSAQRAEQAEQAEQTKPIEQAEHADQPGRNPLSRTNSAFSEPASASVSLSSSASSIYSAAPFSPGPATPISPSKAREVQNVFMSGEDDDVFYLHSTPYTHMHPGFVHGRTRIHKWSLSSSAARADPIRPALAPSAGSSNSVTTKKSFHKTAQDSVGLGASVDWTAFQTAILGGAPEMSDITCDVEDSRTAEDLSGWYSGFGLPHAGRLVEESQASTPAKEIKIAKGASGIPVESARGRDCDGRPPPPATDRPFETGRSEEPISPRARRSGVSAEGKPHLPAINTATAGSIDSNLPYRASPDATSPALTPAPLSVRRKRPPLPTLTTKCLPKNDGALRKGSFEALQRDESFESYRKKGSVVSAPPSQQSQQGKTLRPALETPRLMGQSKSESATVPALGHEMNRSQQQLSPTRANIPTPSSIRDEQTLEASRSGLSPALRAATPELSHRRPVAQDPVAPRSSSAMGRQQAAVQSASLDFSPESEAHQKSISSRSQSARVEQEPFKAPLAKGFQLHVSQLQLPPPRKPKVAKSEEATAAHATSNTNTTPTGRAGGRARNHTLAPSDYALTNINRCLTTKKSQQLQISNGAVPEREATNWVSDGRPKHDLAIAHLPSDDHITFRTPSKKTTSANSRRAAPPKASAADINSASQPLIVGEDTDKFVVGSEELRDEKVELELDQPMGFNLSSDLGDFLRYEAEYAYATDL